MLFNDRKKNPDNEIKGTDDLISRVDQESVIVVDLGAYYTKIGYSGNDQPKFIIPTCVASSKDQSDSEAGTKMYASAHKNEAVWL